MSQMQFVHEDLLQPRAEAASVWIMALKPMSTLPEPMISVTSCSFVSTYLSPFVILWNYAWIVGLEQRDFDAFVFEEALCLG